MFMMDHSTRCGVDSCFPQRSQRESLLAKWRGSTLHGPLRAQNQDFSWCDVVLRTISMQGVCCGFAVFVEGHVESLQLDAARRVQIVLKIFVTAEADFAHGMSVWLGHCSCWMIFSGGFPRIFAHAQLGGQTNHSSFARSDDISACSLLLFWNSFGPCVALIVPEIAVEKLLNLSADRASWRICLVL